MGLEERRQTREIDGFTYDCTPVAFGVGKKMLVRLLNIVAPILAAATQGRVLGGGLSGVFATLPKVVTEAELTAFDQAFGPQSHYAEADGRNVPLVPANMELHFAGRYQAYVKWLQFVIEVNYANFFDDVRAQITSALANAGSLTDALKVDSSTE